MLKIKDNVDLKGGRVMTAEEINKILCQIKEIYKHNSAGGYLHIVIDDGNLLKSNIRYCIKVIKESEENSEIKRMYLDCAESLLEIKLKEREFIYDLIWRT